MDAEQRATRRKELEAKKARIFKQRREKLRRAEIAIAERKQKEIEEARRLAEEEGREFDEETFVKDLEEKEPTLGEIALQQQARKKKEELSPREQKMRKLRVDARADEAIDIHPYETPMYTKTTQTYTPDATVDNEKEEQAEQKRLEALARQKELENQKLLEEAKKKKKEILTPRVLPPSKLEEMMESAAFEKFFDKTSRMVERFFENNSVDATKKGAKDAGKGEKTKKATKGKTDVVGDLPNSLNLLNSYTHQMTRGRAVTDVAWSSEYSELFLAAYDAGQDIRPDAEHTGAMEPAGLVIVWSRLMRSRPEFVCTCDSPIVTACFADWHPSLVIGGCYSGQLVIWDMSKNKHTPHRRTPPSPACHTAPVYAMKMMGTKNAHILITVSTDGRMCQWDLKDLSRPQTTIQLNLLKGSKMPAAINTMSFPGKEVNVFMCGTEEGEVYVAKRLGNDAGMQEQLEGHNGLVTSVDTHPVNGSVDLSFLTLTASIDWSCKLWTRECKRPLWVANESQDYVFDARWSPTHPALFACCDGNGYLDLFNLNKRVESPVSKTDVSSVALHKLRWSADGTSIIAGDAYGAVYLFSVDAKVAEAAPQDWMDFQKVVSGLREEMESEEAEKEKAKRVAPRKAASAPVAPER